MKRFLFLLVGLIALSSCARIDAGHVGIKVNLYGSDKGVDDVTEVTGRVMYNPWTTEIYEWPTFVQDADYDLKILTDDGLSVGIATGLNYRVNPERVAEVFTSYRKPLDQLEVGVLRTRVRKAWSAAMDEYSAEESYRKKEEVRALAEKILTEDLETRGFIVESLVYNSDPELPSSVVNNIKAKVNATQIALKKQDELLQVEADAAKSIAKARADSTVKVVTAAGQAEANRRIAESLTRDLVQYKQILKWNGQVAQVQGGENTGLLLNVNNK